MSDTNNETKVKDSGTDSGNQGDEVKKTVENGTKVVEQIETFVSKMTEEKKLDDRIADIQVILKNGTKQEKDEVFTEIYEDFKYFIKNQIQNLFLLGADKEDLIQEATLCFYNAILNYDKNKGAFVFFARMYIKRNILTLINKSLKNKRNNVNLVYIDGYANDDSKSNYDDYLYYNMIDCDNIEEKIIKEEQYKDLLKTTEDILTPREKKVFYRYLDGLSYDEISKEFNICEKSVDNALHRAKSKIKKYVK